MTPKPVNKPVIAVDVDDVLAVHAQEFAEAGIKVLLFGDYPWNQLDKLPKNMTRLKDWREVLEYFDGKAK